MLLNWRSGPIIPGGLYARPNQPRFFVALLLRMTIGVVSE